MKLHKLIKEISETYFAEKDNVWFKWKIFWTLAFIGFFSLYLLQIYTTYIESLEMINSDFIDPNEFWMTRMKALKIEAIVLGGVFIRFLSSLYRGKRAVRFGEFGFLLAFFSFYRHWLWTIDVKSHYIGCSSMSLIGIVPLAGQIIAMFFLSLLFYKIVFLIAVSWITVRK